MKHFLLPVTCLALVQTLVAQSKPSEQDSSSTSRFIKWSPSIGLSHRSDAMHVFSFNRIEEQWGVGPFDPAGVFKGIGLNLGIAASLANFGLEYAPSLLNHRLSTYLKRTLTIDHQFNIFWQRKLRYSIGYVILYNNMSLDYKWNGPRVQDIEHHAVSLAIAVPVKEIVQVEFKIMYVRSGYPGNPDGEAMLYGLRVFHTFRIGKKVPE